MASHYLGLNRGQTGSSDNDWAYGTSTGSTDMEIRVDDSKNVSREDIRKFLEAAMRFLVTPNVHITGTQFPAGT